ncbi:YIP1 family protein [uncultured Methanofollis sp.]|uniref:YIP1 family protein n=1 Tax=uncultured Methanofollis sp. TaxID=262500 RepID=UPI00260760FA|nr:YIP1 family protein [uncultured Methanofollis sp.]
MSHWILDVLVNPDGFFRERAERAPALMVPFILVLITGIVGAVTAYLSMTAMLPILPPEAQGLTELIGVAVAVGTVIGALIVWALQALLFYALSSFYNGSGDLKKSIEAVGYGYVPLIVSSLIGLVLTYSFLSTFTFPSINVADPAAAGALNEMITNSPLIQAGQILGIIFLVWAANIWIYGMKYARTLTIRDAAVVVGVPVFLYIGLIIILAVL